MTHKRISTIFNKVQEKYRGQEVSPLMVECLYRDISSVIRGLHKTEHFLNFSADCEDKVILVRDEETLKFLGLLPYLDNRLMAKCDEPYLVYFVHDGIAYTQCAVTFKDLYDESDFESYLGFDVQVFPIIPLGVYNTYTNEFTEWRKE